jgi:hypothetical protein
MCVRVTVRFGKGGNPQQSRSNKKNSNTSLVQKWSYYASMLFVSNAPAIYESIVDEAMMKLPAGNFK